MGLKSITDKSIELFPGVEPEKRSFSVEMNGAQQSATPMDLGFLSHSFYSASLRLLRNEELVLENNVHSSVYKATRPIIFKSYPFET